MRWAGLQFLGRLWRDECGSPAVVLAIALPVVAMSVGGVTDFGRVIAQRQRLANTVEQACQATTLTIENDYKKNNATVQTGLVNGVVKIVIDLLIYQPKATTITKNYAQQQGFAASDVTVTVTKDGDSLRIKADNVVPLYFSSIIGIPRQTISTTQKCRTPQAENSSTEPELIFAESFERNHSVAYNSWSVFQNWNGWKTVSNQGGIEINGQPSLAGDTIKFGNFFAELDSDCLGRSNCNAQSQMVRTFDLDPGNYVLSYWYISRVRNPAYGDQVICGAKDSDVSWATWEGQTNRINVSFNQANKTSTIIDICVHTNKWVERRQTIRVNKKGTYDLTFAAAGRADTYGGLLDYIRFCRNECP